MTATKTVTVIADLNDLIALAVRLAVGEMDDRFQLAGNPAYPRLQPATVPGSRYRRRPDVQISAPLYEALSQKWHTNQWGTFIGYRTLRRIIKDAGGPDITAHVVEARAARDKERLTLRQTNNRIELAKALRQVLDLGQPSEYQALKERFMSTTDTREWAGWATRHQRMIASADETLNSLAWHDRACALAVAYSQYGDARADD